MKQAPQRIRFAGLDPNKVYTLEEKNIRVQYNHAKVPGMQVSHVPSTASSSPART